MTRKTVFLIRDMPVFTSLAEDTQKAYPDYFEDSDEELEDQKIRNSDNLLIAGRIEEEECGLDIYVYDEQNYNLYPHHEIMLTSFPVALEWLGCDFQSVEQSTIPRANFCIVGMMTPDIEIWNLDQKEPVEPSFVFSGKGAHSDAVTALALHKVRLNVLCSSSADKTLKVWDLQSLTSLASFKVSNNLIQGLAWDLNEESNIFCHGEGDWFTKFDIRQAKPVWSINLGVNIESFAQSSTNSFEVFLGDDNGFISVLDLKTNKLIQSKKIKAHDKSITNLSVSNNGHLVSSSLDSFIKIYETSALGKITEQLTSGESLLSGSLSPDNPCIYACGSSIGEPIVWNYTNDISEKTTNK